MLCHALFVRGALSALFISFPFSEVPCAQLVGFQKREALSVEEWPPSLQGLTEGAAI